MQPARHTKLEKADILEMTVRYLQTLQRSPTNLNVPNEAVTLHRFKDGFSDCTNEVSRYINEIDGVDVNVKKRLMGHLSNCVTRIQHSTPTHTPAPDDSLSKPEKVCKSQSHSSIFIFIKSSFHRFFSISIQRESIHLSE